MLDWDPELYNRFQAYRAEPVATMLERLALGPDEQIVDLGCGTGQNTVELARRTSGGSVLGIDNSPAMLKRAFELRETLVPELGRRVRFELADFRNFSADGRYTVVFSNAALQWVGDHRVIFVAIHRALREGGRLAVQIPANEGETAQATMHQLAAESKWSASLGRVRTPSAENVLSAAEYRKMLAAAGFREIDCSYHTFRHRMQSPAEIVDFCRSSSLRRFLDHLPPERHAEFLSQFTERLAAAYGTRGPLIFNFRRLFLWARRGRKRARA